ncbi:ribosome silencing factor [Aliifodinibius salipaludis]|uniref:Ribosomal silencing factor RsfS n=1 Tax=Fodinibius salipaludis TaxID=2032627 RepID=A0A2A2GB22_9BACT|nr:ribosome silencing factor [Aliifodinibius salipaludis]PAU94067.1 ribosome silencing factor [Aliifodinibius salipaludis]
MTNTSPQTNQQFSSSNDQKTVDSDKLIEVIGEALLDRKAEDITVLDVHELTTLADKFVICHANTDVQIKAIADNVNKETKEQLNEKAWKEEGRESRRWVILDYVNVVVHIFKKELREYYALERMWNDAPMRKIEDHQ